jgi:hypothetical protein
MKSSVLLKVTFAVSLAHSLNSIAFAAISDEFRCAIVVRDLEGNLISESTLNAAAIRKPSIDLPPTTQSSLNLKSDFGNGAYVSISLNYQHRRGSGVPKAWQSTCFTGAVCEGGSPSRPCSAQACANPGSDPENGSSGWTPVPIFLGGENGIPAFDQSRPLRGDYRASEFVANWSCAHLNTIP